MRKPGKIEMSKVQTPQLSIDNFYRSKISAFCGSHIERNRSPRDRSTDGQCRSPLGISGEEPRPGAGLRQQSRRCLRHGLAAGPSQPQPINVRRNRHRSRRLGLLRCWLTTRHARLRNPEFGHEVRNGQSFLIRGHHFPLASTESCRCLVPSRPRGA